MASAVAILMPGMESGRKRIAMLRVVTSTSAAARLSAARSFLRQLPLASEAIVIGATRGAADDFVRSIAVDAGATFGFTTLNLTEVAAHPSVPGATARPRAP